MKQTKKCLGCGKKMTRKEWPDRKPPQRKIESNWHFNRRTYCSSKCACNSKEWREKTSKRNSYDKNPAWKGGRVIWAGGYIMIKNREHPFTTKSGYIPEHRLVMEKFLGRYLKKGESTHHINGIRDDNRIENLELRTNLKNHQGRIICPYCKKGFNPSLYKHI